MFQIIWSCISQLWELLCESISSTNTSQTPSSPPSDSMPCTTNCQALSSSVSDSVPTSTTNSQIPSSSPSESTTSQTQSSSVSDLVPSTTISQTPSSSSSDSTTSQTQSSSVSDLLPSTNNSQTPPSSTSESMASTSISQTPESTFVSTSTPTQYDVFLSFRGEDTRHTFTGHLYQRLHDHGIITFKDDHVINEIVNELLLKINPKTLDVTKYPVGLDSRVEAITTLLSSDTKGVIKFGIYGMGGVGKTTLAKALFNQLVRGGRFKGSCFLANVRENSGTAKGLVSLQMQLINDVLRSTTKVEVPNVDQGIKLIEARICSTKVVVVIDDLDDLKHFQSLVGPFASGSVVIITTRDEEILDKTEVQIRHRYMVDTLDDADSLALFTRHAFGNAEPNDTLMGLSKDILHLAGGLPLALEVFRSHLYTRPEVGWKSYIEKLQRSPNSSIQQRLEISLDALESDDPNLKKMFLDIACFFIGRGKQDVVRIMESCYSYADHLIDVLKKRCLLTINNGCLEMHDLLQDVGKEIVLKSSPDEPEKRSRLWVLEDICDVLKNHNGTEAIECINYRERAIDGVTFTTDTFKRMSKLRFLSLENVNLTGSFEQIFKDLRWLRWDSCSLKCLPSEFCPQKLVILELPQSSMRTMWELNMTSLEYHVLKL